MKWWHVAVEVTFEVGAETRAEAEAIAVELGADLEPDRAIRYRGRNYQSIDVTVSQFPVADS